ncbi:uncharacterized protein LOC107785721 [Nicotiana tabacum]|uniref:Uncharacterized protein LOC107785721 n=1 Tax=Nicotiana tabacum TaxID=4097 RepID=A0AC58UT04_TOBAC
MNDVRRVDDNIQDKVTLPNGVTTKIEHVGSSYLSDVDKLENVLHVPDFKFNLMSVSKLTRDLRCAVILLPTLCVFQDLYNGRVKAIGKENKGLYILKGRRIKLLAANVDVGGSSAETAYLWHERLGHASVPVRQHVSFLHNKVDDNMQNKCTVCPLAKQYRLSFPNSEKMSAGCYKSETITFLKQFISMVKTQFDTCVKVVRTDNDMFGGNQAVHMGYSTTQKDYRLYDLTTRTFFISRDVSFRENEFPFRKITQHSFTTNDFGSSFLETIDVQGQPGGLPTGSNLEESFQVPATADIGNSSPVEYGSIRVSTETSTTENLEGPSVSNENHDAVVLESVEVFSVLKEPYNFKEAVEDERWITAMEQEIQALEDNKTWEVIDLPPGKTPIGSKSVIALAAAKDWSLHQMDVFNSFLQGDLFEEVFMDLPQGFQRSNKDLIDEAKAALYQQFKLKDLGKLMCFLGIEVLRSNHGILLHQMKYSLELISELGLSGAKPALTPLEVNQKLTSVEYDRAIGIQDKDPLADANKY